MAGAKFGLVFSALVLIIFLASAGLAHGRSAKAAHGGVQQKPFGATKEGKAITLYTLTNSHHMEVRAMNYGAIIVSLRVPDRKAQVADIVLGHDTLEGYFDNSPHLGGLVGRYANRIANGSFPLDGVKYSLPKNNGPNTLHGGIKGFDQAVWQGAPLKGKTGVEFSYLSKDGEEGFPGNLKVKVTYALTEANELLIDYEATTDKPTVLNLSQHSYFNLAGEGAGDILNHEVMINADRFTPVDSTMIPTGELRPVKGTPLDFTTQSKLGARIDDNYEQLVLAKGYDHNFVINGKAGGLVLAARAYEPSSGRIIEISTDQPGVQFYTGNFLDGTVTGKRGHVYKRRYGLCFETQHFPDSPNHPEFPSTVLRPGETFHSRTIWRFSAK
jgi:aldose 1-epimerase